MIKINLLTEPKTESPKPVRWRIYAGVTLLILMGTGVGLLFWGKEKAPSSRPAAQGTPELSDYDAAKEKKVEQNRVIAETFEQSTGKACIYSHILTDIRTNIPLAVHLSTIGFVHPGECFIQGRVASALLAEELARRLERFSGVKTAEPPSVEKGRLTGNGTDFQFTIWMKTDEVSAGIAGSTVPVRASLFVAQIQRQAAEYGVIPGKWVFRQERLMVDVNGRCGQIESLLAGLSESGHFSNLARIFILPTDGESLNWENLRVCLFFDLADGEG